MNVTRTRAACIGAIAGISLIGAVALNGTSAAAASPPTSGYTVPSPPTSAQVDAAVLAGVEYIDCQQNSDGSFGDQGPGASGDVPETAGAIVGLGTLAKHDIANLPTSHTDPACAGTHNLRTDMTNAVTWLLGQQDTTAPSSEGNGGSWTFGSDTTYATGLALTALSFSSTVPTTPANAVATAITNGRAFLANDVQAPPNGACSTVWASSGDTSFFCGGWDYDAHFGSHSDESNTGFALTGLALTGGVPPSIQAVNLGWQSNVQADTLTNPHWAATRNDGGGSYEPDLVDGAGPASFTSNSNNTGSLMFGFADDGLTTADPRVQAALQLGTDALDTLEKAAHSSVSVQHTMVYHTGTAEDGSCDPSTGGCDWALGSGEGGFHYSMFALSKGLGAFITPKLSDGANWYAKIADLLVNEQGATAGADLGSWPPDPRDDFTQLFATELSVFSLGLVGVAATPSPTPSGIPVPSVGIHPNPTDNGGMVIILFGVVTLAVALVVPRTRRRGRRGSADTPLQVP